MTSSESVPHHLVCGCGPHNRRRPHLAVVWRPAAYGAMPELWRSAAVVIAEGSCALRYDADHLIALVPCAASLSGTVAGDAIDEWHRQITADLGPVSAGRSATHAGATGLDQAVAEALCALQLGERAHGPGRVTAYGDVFILDYATRMLADSRLCGLYDRVPSRLRTIERGELLRTLEAFLATGSVQAAALRLNVHRNSLKYRLKRIEKITRIDLEDPEMRFLVQLALHAHRELAAQAQRAADFRYSSAHQPAGLGLDHEGYPAQATSV
jgi:PucR-like helix-turn-helix protein/diguanylate cyclase with GGDEF domain